MIPDKIYIHEASAPELALPRKAYHLEYLRKDALLEWLESKVYEHNEDRFDDGFDAALGQVIDKLNSM